MPPKRFQFSLNPLWPHYLSWACVGVAMVLGLLRYGFIGAFCVSSVQCVRFSLDTKNRPHRSATLQCVAHGGSMVGYEVQELAARR